MIKAAENVFLFFLFYFILFFVQLDCCCCLMNNPLKCYLNINRLFFSIKLIVGGGEYLKGRREIAEDFL